MFSDGTAQSIGSSLLPRTRASACDGWLEGCRANWSAVAFFCRAGAPLPLPSP
jgi:hypothetical protein